MAPFAERWREIAYRKGIRGRLAGLRMLTLGGWLKGAQFLPRPLQWSVMSQLVTIPLIAGPFFMSDDGWPLFRWLLASAAVLFAATIVIQLAQQRAEKRLLHLLKERGLYG